MIDYQDTVTDKIGYSNQNIKEKPLNNLSLNSQYSNLELNDKIQKQQQQATIIPKVSEGQLVREYSQFADIFLNSEFDPIEFNTSYGKNQFILEQEIQSDICNKSKKSTQEHQPCIQQIIDQKVYLNSPDQCQLMDYQDEDNEKLNSTNITKNYIRGMIQYIKENEQLILKQLDKKGIKLQNPKRFFTLTLKTHKKKMYSIKHLKKMILQDNAKSKVYRIFGYRYIRTEAFQQIYNGKIKNKENLLKFRQILDKAFREPQSFTKLI